MSLYILWCTSISVAALLYQPLVGAFQAQAILLGAAANISVAVISIPREAKISWLAKIMPKYHPTYSCGLRVLEIYILDTKKVPS